MDKSKILCAFDFETIADPFKVDLLPVIKQNKNLKDPDKIKADIDKKKEKQFSEMGLNPHTNLICCASFQDVYTGEKRTIQMFDIPSISQYKEYLCSIWETLSRYGTYTTFNGIAFDIEVLKFHSMIHRVKPVFDIGQNKNRITNHVDVRMLLGRNNDHAHGSLSYYSKIILGEEQGASGSEIQKLWDDREYEKIKEKCEKDVDCLSRIYIKLKGYYV